jgi:c-di-GMP-binding flagellar brake protein YcgR
VGQRLSPPAEIGMHEEKRSDRRKYGRLATDQVISFAPVEARDLLGVSRNISLGGIRFEAVGCEIDLGDVLRVTFNIGDDTVVAVGKVKWSTEVDPITTDVGLEFIEIDPEAARMIEEILTEVDLP